MTHAQALVISLKVVLVAAIVTSLMWQADYIRFTRGRVLRDSLGLTVFIKTGLVIMLLAITTVSVFFDFNRLTSEVAGWIDVGLIGLISPVMIWRDLAFRAEERRRSK